VSGSDSIEAQVKELIVELLFLRDVTPGDIGDEDVIEETLGVDSVQLFQIVAGLEETFDILFGDEDFDATRFRTVKAVADVVREKQAAG
jgi:acyl carrier protein